MKRLTDPTFRYVSAVDTDIRKTFKRVRVEIKARKAEQAEKVRPLPKKGVGNGD
jgi:hypothetical protein